MDISVLPLAEVDLKIEDVAIKFENDDDKAEFDDINDPYESGMCESSGMQENFNLLRDQESYDKVNFHFLTASSGKVESNEPHRRFQCNCCLRLFMRNDHLKNHMRTHTGERPYECDLCQRSFAKHFDLTRHKQYVHGSVTTFFICEECGRTFSRKDHLKSHLVTHKTRPLKVVSNPDGNRESLLKTFACEMCGRAYCRLENLKKHMEKHCGSVDSASCIPKGVINDLKDETITENIFKGINFHFMSVDDVKPRVDNTAALRSFACEFCDRLFVRKDHLKNHERTHTGERPFQCDRCDKRFAKRFVMTRHLRNVHRIDTKMHKCTECERMFARTDHLKTHMKIHILAAVRRNQNAENRDREKLHKCDICQREFTRSDNLKTHMKIHLLAAVKRRQQEMGADGKSGNETMTFPGEIGRSYFCEICEESFPNVEKLESHEESHRSNGGS